MENVAEAGGPTEAAGDARRHKLAFLVDEFRTRYATLIAFAVMVAIFWILKPTTFGTIGNLKAILNQAAPLVVIGIGLTVVLVVGEFDLSFAGIVSLASVLSVKILEHNPASIAVLLGLGVGVGAGIVAGLLVSTERASSFIVTLALSTIWSGLAVGISGSQTISITDNSYLNITFNTFLGFPNPVWIAAVVMVIAYAIIRFTVFGRQAQAVGSNTGAARLAGVRINFTRVGAYAFLGFCSGLAAILLSSSIGQFTPDIGAGLFIPPYVAAFFGVSVLGARRFNIFGTVVGALFIGTLQTGLTIVGAASWIADVVIGAALIAILVIAAKKA